MLQLRPNIVAQTNLSFSFFACDRAANHTFPHPRSGQPAFCARLPHIVHDPTNEDVRYRGSFSETLNSFDLAVLTDGRVFIVRFRKEILASV